MQKIFELSSSMSFLIIDESESYRNLISTGLKKLGFKNIRMTSGSMHALQILKSANVDFIICDRNMSVIDGSQLLKEVRESFDIQGTPFLMIGSGSNVTKEDVVLLAEYEVDGYLTKPFTFKVLTEKIKQCVEHYKSPDNIEFNIAKAKQALLLKDLTSATQIFQEQLNISPESARIRVCLARCNREIGNFDIAIDFCKQAINKNSLYVQAYDELGNIYLAQDKFDEAIAYFKHAIAISPNNPLRYDQVSEILLENKKYKEAEILLKKAKESGVAFDDLNYKFGKTLFYLGKIDKSILYFEKALQKTPNNKSILNMLGICLKDTGRGDEALKYYNIALKHYPMDTKIMFNKALCFMKLRRYEQAKKIFNYILTIDPKNKKVINKLADVERKINPLP